MKAIILRDIRKYLTLLIFVGLLSGCYKEKDLPFNSAEILKFYLQDEQLEVIHDARGVKFEINNPRPELYYDDDQFHINKFELRGQSALNYRRKSYNVKLYEFLPVNSIRNVQINNFRLLSMTTDYTYIENYISLTMLKEVGIMPLFFQYIEVKMNDNNEGLYILINNPEYYSLKEILAPFILRRGYNGSIDNFEYNAIAPFPVEKYTSRFNNIYEYIIDYSGRQLYDSLFMIMNIKNYFRKIAVDYLIRNGDYTDEIYFYSANGDHVYFDIIPWDYDDIFQNSPHEVGNDWGVGNRFGVRSYASNQDIINEIGDKFIFSIEDDLDYKIATDSFLYQNYLVEFKYVLDMFTNGKIDSIFEITNKNINIYIKESEIIKQTKYDQKSFNYNDYINNLDHKKSLLKSIRNQSIIEFNEL